MAFWQLPSHPQGRYLATSGSKRTLLDPEAHPMIRHDDAVKIGMESI